MGLPVRALAAMALAVALFGCRDHARVACQADCRHRHDACLLAASTREAIATCDGQASWCTEACP